MYCKRGIHENNEAASGTSSEGWVGAVVVVDEEKKEENVEGQGTKQNLDKRRLENVTITISTMNIMSTTMVTMMVTMTVTVTMV